MRTLLAIHCYILTVKLHNALFRNATVTAALSQSHAGFQLFSGVNSMCKHLLTKISPQVVVWSH